MHVLLSLTHSSCYAFERGNSQKLLDSDMFINGVEFFFFLLLLVLLYKMSYFHVALSGGWADQGQIHTRAFFALGCPR